LNEKPTKYNLISQYKMMDVAVMPINSSFAPAGTNMEWEPLRTFLWTKSFISTPSEGFFAVLTSDLRKEVWAHIDDHKTFARACQVNKLWKSEMEVAWKNLATQRHILDELPFWEERGKNWKWVAQCKLVKFTEAEQKNGCGTFNEANGTYEGEWIANNKEGLGKKAFTDKSVYMGSWKNNMKEGEGIYIWQDNTKYVGHWKEDKYHGYGVKSWSDGDQYEGCWKEDKKHGRGTYKWSNGDKYEGEWEEDKQHGKGFFVWATGVQYLGNFKENMRNDPHAVLTWPNGDRYEGGFKDNMIEGQGKYCHASGDQYIGEWKASQRHGRATYIYQYGGRFIGYFEDDERNGPGVFEWPDGDRFEGVWKHGSRYGKGTFISKKGGKSQVQEWREAPHSNYAEFIPRKSPNDDMEL
jgi:hypothetical protein